jgi:hypothetical protein
MYQIKTFEDFRSYLQDERYDALESLADRIEELTEFQRGSYHGEIATYDNMLGLLRDILKYGEDPV